MKSVMPFNLDDMLVVAITARALFDRHESDQVHAEQGLGRWEEEDSNLRRRQPAILQTAPFGRSGILPGTPRG